MRLGPTYMKIFEHFVSVNEFSFISIKSNIAWHENDDTVMYFSVMFLQTVIETVY